VPIGDLRLYRRLGGTDSRHRLRALKAVVDLAVIVVSAGSERWLEPCLRTLFERAGSISLDVVVVENASVEPTRELLESGFPEARLLTCENRGFAHANNEALMTCDARYVLFLNPDTELRAGTLEELVSALDERPTVGLAGVRQVTPDGMLAPTIRHFPNAVRALGEALGSERLPWRGRWLGERELDLSRYDEEVACDWTSGSFMIARREAIESAGFLDERFFLYSEETDLCRRIKTAGWEIRHLPTMTILHHGGSARLGPKMAAQDAYTRLQYARKHFSPAHRIAYVAALRIRYVLRLLTPPALPKSRDRRAAALQALRMTLRGAAPPFGAPPGAAVTSREKRRLVEAAR
jgi:N-acetylglucosaminyl-diphospho-decaprenol L-rhamnosyltransferase